MQAKKAAGSTSSACARSDEFDYIKASFAAFDLGDVGLRLADPVSDLLLCQPLVAPRGDKARHEVLIGGRVQGFCHSLQPSSERFD